MIAIDIELLTIGPRRINRNLEGTGTSVRSPKNVPWLNRMKAESGLSRKSTSPTRMFEASAPGGILRIKWRFPCGKQVGIKDKVYNFN